MSLDKERLEKAIDLLKSLDIEKPLCDAAAASQISDQSPMNSPSNSTSTTESVKPAPPPGQPITIDLKGLASMHSPDKTSILYIPPSDPTKRLYPFCLALQKTFQTEGFLLPDNRELKLHATIVNTVYAKGRKKRSTPKQEARIDGTPPSHPPSDPSEEPSKAEDGVEMDQGRSQTHGGPQSNAPLKFDARTLLEEYKDFVWADNVVLDRIAICEMGAKKLVDPGSGEVVGEEYVEVARVGMPVG